jgi:hypothetical protein
MLKNCLQNGIFLLLIIRGAVPPVRPSRFAAGPARLRRAPAGCRGGARLLPSAVGGGRARGSEDVLRCSAGVGEATGEVAAFGLLPAVAEANELQRHRPGLEWP